MCDREHKQEEDDYKNDKDTNVDIMQYLDDEEAEINSMMDDAQVPDGPTVKDLPDNDDVYKDEVLDEERGTTMGGLLEDEMRMGVDNNVQIGEQEEEYDNNFAREGLEPDEIERELLHNQAFGDVSLDDQQMNEASVNGDFNPLNPNIPFEDEPQNKNLFE